MLVKLWESHQQQNMSKDRTRMRRIPPSTQEMTTTASRAAVNTHIETYLNLRKAAHNWCDCYCFIFAFEIVWLTIIAVEATVSKCTSERQNRQVQHNICISRLSCNILTEFNTESTWGSQLHIMYTMKHRQLAPDMKKLLCKLNWKCGYSRLTPICHCHLPTWTRYKEKHNHLNTQSFTHSTGNKLQLETQSW